MFFSKYQKKKEGKKRVPGDSRRDANLTPSFFRQRDSNPEAMAEEMSKPQNSYSFLPFGNQNDDSFKCKMSFHCYAYK